MKIAYIAAAQIPSMKANSIQVMKVCQALRLNGETVHLYVPGTRQYSWNELKAAYGINEEFPITWIPAVKGGKGLDFILRSVFNGKKANCEVIYTRAIWAAFIGLWINLPIIYEVHDIPGGRIGSRLFRSYLLSKKKKLTVMITRALKEKIEERFQFHFTDKDSIVAPDGVDLDRYAHVPNAVECRKRLGFEEKITAIYTGGFYPGRGVDLLFSLAIAFPQVQFIWIGGEKDSIAYWSDQIREHAVANINLTGFIPNKDLPLYQGAADILLMPFGKIVSVSGGGNTADICSPMKMFEYMAAGRAILSSDIPVLREVLNESNAMFYAAEDLEDLKRQFSVLLEDQARRHTIALKAAEDVKAYEWKTRMDQIMQVFKS